MNATPPFIPKYTSQNTYQDLLRQNPGCIGPSPTVTNCPTAPLSVLVTGLSPACLLSPATFPVPTSLGWWPNGNYTYDPNLAATLPYPNYWKSGGWTADKRGGVTSSGTSKSVFGRMIIAYCIQPKAFAEWEGQVPGHYGDTTIPMGWVLLAIADSSLWASSSWPPPGYQADTFPGLAYFNTAPWARCPPRDGWRAPCNVPDQTSCPSAGGITLFASACKDGPCVGMAKPGGYCPTNMRLEYDPGWSCCQPGGPYRNPVLGYRAQRSCCSGGRPPTNTVYKDAYAKTCGEARDDPLKIGVCYQPLVRKIQNRNGYINNHYNYSSGQYLERRCRNFRQLAFNFQPTSKTDQAETPSHAFSTRCRRQDSLVGEQKTALECGRCCATKCLGYSPTDASNSDNCYATYKPNNRPFSRQGAVSGGSRINRLKYQTRLKAQSIYKPLEKGSSACQIKCKVKNMTGSVNATNGMYPVSLYRNTYPTYKRNLSGLCPSRGIYTCRQNRQRCWVPTRGKLCCYPRISRGV